MVVREVSYRRGCVAQDGHPGCTGRVASTVAEPAMATACPVVGLHHDDLSLDAHLHVLLRPRLAPQVGWGGLDQAGHGRSLLVL